MLSSFV